MKPSYALKIHREEVKKAVRARKAFNARIFGSVLAGTDTEGSDLDLLVDTLPGTTLFELGGLQVDLEEILGVPVDLLTPGDLPAKFRDKVLHEAKEI
ncbi:nucleotidyltransferase family protein [Syntrophotalea acetylenica]|uniref:Nucleotidyltransferase n=1 Tax=Syntrophotalea acetylenica TaxID=29542 RepID=A0A1L3GIG5_SYNAC|nr:nucleotidyltransferase family protein [Syntrophotalea acetylenica]APG25709.1 nucleotidyltransferase [Syntrophotalea acetylenica]APG43782.1 nucleotidyltransferase [Syntrophotalea acetylenica]NCB25174.1 nucleotidyltransferase [Bacteroidia bacterium]